MEDQEVSILVVGSEEFGGVVIRILKNAYPRGFIRSVIWEAATPIWCSRLFQETNLFILEMFRQYPTGFRAEGLITAAQIVRSGARPFVVGPFPPDAIGNYSHIKASATRSEWFWSVDDGGTLTERVSLAISTRLSVQGTIDLTNAARVAIKQDELLLVNHR